VKPPGKGVKKYVKGGFFKGDHSFAKGRNTWEKNTLFAEQERGDSAGKGGERCPSSRSGGANQISPEKRALHPQKIRTKHASAPKRNRIEKNKKRGEPAV